MSRKIICSILFFLCGCVSNATDVQPIKVASDFYHKYVSTSERIKQFKNYSLEEQYEIFEFGNRVVHPPATYLDSPFAEQGPIIVPFLKMKLEATKDEATIRNIALIFSEVARLKLYDFSKDTELMNLLNQKVNNMQGSWKNIALKFLSEIQSGKLAR
ncbi:MAG: hypothetical protein V2B19_10870 [Pseudomonadota bacterium]